VLRAVDVEQRPPELHLFTYVVGNALFWITWGAISVSSARWYVWPLVPATGWALVLIWHLRRVRSPALTSNTR
jgi:hypothetical protein